MKAAFVTVSCLLAAFGVLTVHGQESNCPPAESIFPCTCQNRDLTCRNIVNNEVLRRVFQNVSGQSFDQLWILTSTFQYIPHEIFEEVEIREIYIIASTLVDLFDAPPTSLTMLEKIQVQATTLLRISWKHLTALTSLKELNIFATSFPVLDETFGKTMPKSLKELVFTATTLRTIKPGTFHGLDNIEYLGIKGSKLTSLRRDIFPTPFNVEKLSFIENKLVSIPKDLFTEMPNLKEVDLRVNNISSIPEEAFGESSSQLDLLLLDINPLNCDCELEWLLTKGPKTISGVCETPVEMEGKPLSQLTTDDFDC